MVYRKEKCLRQPFLTGLSRFIQTLYTGCFEIHIDTKLLIKMNIRYTIIN